MKTPALRCARPKASWLRILRYVRIFRARWFMTEPKMACSVLVIMACSIFKASRLQVHRRVRLPRVQLEQRGDKLFAIGLEA